MSSVFFVQRKRLTDDNATNISYSIEENSNLFGKVRGSDAG